MASTHARVPLYISAYQEIPPSPTLTNPDMILPFDERPENSQSLSVRPSSSAVQSDVVSNSSFDGVSPSTRPRSDSEAEVGIATAVALPMLVRGRVATTNQVPSALPVYLGYEHGAPLSDIGEEAEEITMKSLGSSPDHSRSPSKQAPQLRHKKRLSDLSTSSGESEKTEQWDSFDTSQLMSDRVAADIAQARDDAEENDDTASRRSSREVEEELSVLNDRAEKILANARKRLSSMEDNLTKARHSILLSPRSIPNMHELGHQPAGGLYRSISQNAHNRRSKGLFPSLKIIQHTRTGSDMAPVSGLKRLSGIAEPRSASAMDFSPARYGVGFITSETKPSPPSKLSTHSPSSSRSYPSPLRILAEESELETPSTVKTSPDSSLPNASSFTQPRGLGIHALGAKAQEDLTRIPSQAGSSESPTSLHRSSSQASTRSARDLRDQMSEMKTRIADLRNKAQADSLRRRSLQSLRTPSPFLYPNANGHDGGDSHTGAGPSNQQQQQSSTTPTGQPSSHWGANSRQGHERKDSVMESVIDQAPASSQTTNEPSEVQVGQYPVTPVTARLRNALDVTPVHPSSARTDRNTPNLVSRTTDVYQYPALGAGQVAQNIESEEAEQDFNTSEEDEQIASSQEEQIYLNEVLEESLHDIEPGVPSIPGEYLIGDELVELQSEETERHEDRLDAFDYENMFLHSAMGTYLGDQASDESDGESLATDREDVKTPIMGLEYEDQSTSDESVHRTHQNSHIDQPNTPTSMKGATTPSQRAARSPITPLSHPRSPLRENVNGRLRTPPQPWAGMARTKSMETMSSVASYTTATEGDGDGDYDDEDEDFHDEILNWGNAPPSHSNGQLPYMPTHSVSAKAQNVLGWPTPPMAQSTVRHSSYIRPQQNVNAGGHFRTASGGVARVVHGRSPLSSVQYSAFPFPSSGPTHAPPNQPLPPPPPPSQSDNQAAVTHQANTEILMESLIKLADPDFSIESTGRSNFADIDKDLVLGLLRAVGEVCDGVLRAQTSRRGSVVKELRSRLVNAKEVLVGVSEQEGLEEILEDDEDE